MSELVASLPDDFWEIGSPYRREWVRDKFPAGVPEDLVELPEEGAQSGLAVARLDDRHVAVATHSAVVEDRYDLHILKRADGGWSDVTEVVFPFEFSPRLKIELRSDKTIFAAQPSGNVRQYLWSGSHYYLEGGEHVSPPSQP